MPQPISSVFEWTHRLHALGDAFYTRLNPQGIPTPSWGSRNLSLLKELGWSAQVLSDDFLPAWAGNTLLPGCDPIATVYSGHQFGVWAGQLGDGRALLLGEAQSQAGTQEIQLKGAGRTPYSRMGDGRAVLRSSIREYLCSEAMHGLGIPTTRALALVASPMPVYRERAETAAVVTRVAPSFLRFGHFEHFAAKNRKDLLQQLADHAIAQHLPQAQERAPSWNGNSYAGLLDEVVQRTARLIAQWQAVGFCHGVMNTDNMSVLGLTLDYGPFQFMDGFDPGHICNHSDTHGRYAWDQQPDVAYWNLLALGQALHPLIDDVDLIRAVIKTYEGHFVRDMGNAMRAKLGLTGPLATDDQREADWLLVQDLLQCLARERVDYPLFWRRLSQAVAHEDGQWDLRKRHWQEVTDLWLQAQPFEQWLQRYRQRLGGILPAAVGQAMLRSNPKYVLRNHLAQVAIAQAEQGDFSEVDTLLHLLQSPYDEHPGHEHRAQLPPDWAAHLQLSCSS